MHASSETVSHVLMLAKPAPAALYNSKRQLSARGSLGQALWSRQPEEDIGSCTDVVPEDEKDEE